MTCCQKMTGIYAIGLLSKTGKCAIGLMSKIGKCTVVCCFMRTFRVTLCAIAMLSTVFYFRMTRFVFGEHIGPVKTHFPNTKLTPQFRRFFLRKSTLWQIFGVKSTLWQIFRWHLFSLFTYQNHISKFSTSIYSSRFFRL